MRFIQVIGEGLALRSCSLFSLTFAIAVAFVWKKRQIDKYLLNYRVKLFYVQRNTIAILSKIENRNPKIMKSLCQADLEV